MNFAQNYSKTRESYENYNACKIGKTNINFKVLSQDEINVYTVYFDDFLIVFLLLEFGL